MSDNIASVTDGFYYFYSAVAQVVATLLGLVLAGFAIYQNHLRSLVEKDDSYTDIVKQLLKIQSRKFKFFIITSLILLVLCLGILRNEEDFASITNRIKFLEVYILMLLGLQIFRLINTMVNTHAISDRADAMLAELNRSKSTVTSEEFMILYTKLEKSIENHFAKHYPNLISNKYFSTDRKVRELVYLEPIFKILICELRELIKIRNLLVHSKTKEVPLQSFNDLKNVLVNLKIDINTYANGAGQSPSGCFAL